MDALVRLCVLNREGILSPEALGEIVYFEETL